VRRPAAARPGRRGSVPRRPRAARDHGRGSRPRFAACRSPPRPTRLRAVARLHGPHSDASP